MDVAMNEMSASDGADTFPTLVLEISVVGPEGRCKTGESEGGGGKTEDRDGDKDNRGRR